MSYLLDSVATLRLVRLDPEDPLVRWIGARRIRPYVSPVSVGRVLDFIRRDPALEPAARADYEARLERLVEGLGDAGLRVAFTAPFTPQAALVWGELLGLGGTGVQAVELIPVATALCQSMAIIDGKGEASLADLAQRIPARLGVLTVVDADAPA